MATNQECKIILDIYTLKDFHWYKEHFIWTKFTPYTFLSNIQKVIPQGNLVFP